MKPIASVVLALGLALPAGALARPVPYAPEHVVEAGDSEADIAEKAAKVLPRSNQVA